MSPTPTMGTAAERPNHRQRRHPDLPPAVLDRWGTAEYLSIGLSTLAELTASGSIPSLRLQGRRLYRRTDLDAWLSTLVTGGGPAA